MNFLNNLRGKTSKPQVQYSNVFSQDFDLTKNIGSGQFGIVSLARSKHTGQEFAVKVWEESRIRH
jgi:serine/threonine protein kinase